MEVRTKNIPALIAAYECGNEEERKLMVGSKVIDMTVDGKEALRFLGKDARATYMIEESVWTNHRRR